MGSGAHRLRHVLMVAVCRRHIPSIATGQHDVEPRQGRDGAACADADGTRVERIEFLGYESFALTVTIPCESADCGLHSIETLAAVKTNVVTIRSGILIDGLYHARCSAIKKHFFIVLEV